MWKILIDTSGMPPDNIYIGMFLITDGYVTKFFDEFYNKFPELRHYKQKSTKIKSDILFNILKFFDEKRLRMTCYHFKDFQWKIHEKRINQLMKEINEAHTYKNNIGGFKEKILGILYYYAITHTGVKKDSYDVVVCQESYLDIVQVIDTVYKLAKRDGWHLKIVAQLRKHEHLLKMADYVAGANRKNEEFKLNLINKHTILKDPIKDFDLKKVFKIYKNINRNVYI